MNLPANDSAETTYVARSHTKKDRNRAELSSDQLAFLELGAAEGFGLENLSQYLDSVPDVGEAEIERGKAETEDVGHSKVADHAAGNERLHECKGSICRSQTIGHTQTRRHLTT